MKFVDFLKNNHIWRSCIYLDDHILEKVDKTVIHKLSTGYPQLFPSYPQLIHSFSTGYPQDIGVMFAKIFKSYPQLGIVIHSY